MTPATIAPFEPMDRREYLKVLEASAPWPALTPELWNQIHDEVQEQLQLLETEVHRKTPEIRVNADRTKGDSFFLFSYRTFSVPDSDLDPVVAGITFTPAPHGVTVEADVSGEQTGDCLLSLSSKTFANSLEELLAVAHKAAARTCQAADAIVAALKDSSRRG